MILITLMVMAYGRTATEAAVLRKSVTVTSEQIRLGDIFEATGKSDQEIVAAAPPPGQRRIIGPPELVAIARDHGIDWTPPSRNTRVVVERAGRRIDFVEIEAAVKQSLAAHGLPEFHRVKLANASIRVFAALDRDESFFVKGTRYSAQTGRFTTTLYVPYGGRAISRVPLSGHVEALIRVPVPVRRLKPGDTITDSDLEWLAVETRRANRLVLVDADALIGKTPRRMLVPGRPIRKSEVRDPIVVAKGSLVTLLLRTPNMTLTAKVKATMDGALGETIRVINTRSGKAVEGVVTQHGTVIVPHVATESLVGRAP